MQWEHADTYTLEAAKRFLKVRSDLPVKFLSGKWYKGIGSARQGVFRVIVNEEFLNPQTNGIDLVAKIPSHIEDEKRVILRIAYSILVNWQRAVIEAYKVAEKDGNKITYINAMAWYGELK